MINRIGIVLLLYLGATTPMPAQHQASHEKLIETGGSFLRTCAVIEKPTKSLSSSELLEANYCSAYVSGRWLKPIGRTLDFFMSTTMVSGPMPHVTSYLRS